MYLGADDFIKYFLRTGEKIFASAAFLAAKLLLITSN